ncbi:MAG: peptidylprolyl isomerase [Planctomycetota bacterium]|nr:peptidylprolyl isomerase [Planctomycetota bacterium]
MTNRTRLLSLVFLASLHSCVLAQLTPDRLYYGIDRPVPMKVTIPEGKAGDPSIQLFTPAGTEPIATASVLAGPVNLATLFADLWKPKDGKPAIHYAQLVVGNERIGAPVVLQPLVDAPMAEMSGGDPKPRFRPGSPMNAGLRAYVDKDVVLTTSHGDIEFRMRPDQAPNTVWNFRHLVEGGFYTDIIFHRIVNNNPRLGAPFVIQVGDPTGTGGGGPGYSIDLEDSKLKHDFGVLSMAREPAPNTGGSQVFVCLSRAGTSFLDGAYTSFAEAVSGADAIRKIAAVPCGPDDRPADPAPKIISARLVDAPPFGTGPKPVSAGVTQSGAPSPAAGVNAAPAEETPVAKPVEDDRKKR